eukprot:scaffold15395_cov147-Isochrysis_galbana.AAC.4
MWGQLGPTRQLILPQRPGRATKAVATHHRSFTRRVAGVQSFIVAANLRWQNTQEVEMGFFLMGVRPR